MGAASLLACCVYAPPLIRRLHSCSPVFFFPKISLARSESSSRRPGSNGNDTRIMGVLAFSIGNLAFAAFTLV
jgi:hypothetical protein